MFFLQAYAFQQLADFLPRVMRNLEDSGQSVMTFIEHIVRTRYGAPDAAGMLKHPPEFRGFNEPILNAVGTLIHNFKVLEQNFAYRDVRERFGYLCAEWKVPASDLRGWFAEKMSAANSNSSVAI
jgi:hypothetical protein